MNAYIEKLNKLPANVRDFLDSVTGLNLNLLICKQSGLTGDDVLRNTDLVVDLFFKEIDLNDLVERIKDDFDFDDVKAKKLAADVAGIRLLVVDDIWFKGMVSAYLKNLGVPPANYQKIVDEQKVSLRKEKEEDVIEEMEKKAERVEREAVLTEPEEAPIKREVPAVVEDFKINWEEEKAEVQKLFKNGLADIISAGVVQQELNDVLIYLLTDKGDVFRGELERALLVNNEVLTFSKFVVGGRPSAAVISAWLKNFISEVGSGMFDNLALTKFLTNSANTKVLSEEEKMIVKRLLLFYRNLKFFPQSMPNKTGEGWEIVPSGVSEALTKAKTISIPSTEDFALPKVEPVKIDNKANENKLRLSELEKISGRYSPGSLEKKAVEEEIKKVNKK